MGFKTNHIDYRIRQEQKKPMKKVELNTWLLHT